MSNRLWVLVASGFLSCARLSAQDTLTNAGQGVSTAFSRKLENHTSAVALNYFVYNFLRIHRTLRVTPAMAAGVTVRLWEISDLGALLLESESKKAA